MAPVHESLDAAAGYSLYGDFYTKSLGGHIRKPAIAASAC